MGDRGMDDGWMIDVYLLYSLLRFTPSLAENNFLLSNYSASKRRCTYAQIGTVAHVQQLLLSPRRTSTAVRKTVPVSIRVSLVKITVCCDGLRPVTSSAGITGGGALEEPLVPALPYVCSCSSPDNMNHPRRWP